MHLQKEREERCPTRITTFSIKVPCNQRKFETGFPQKRLFGWNEETNYNLIITLFVNNLCGNFSTTTHFQFSNVKRGFAMFIYLNEYRCVYAQTTVCRHMFYAFTTVNQLFILIRKVNMQVYVQPPPRCYITFNTKNNLITSEFFDTCYHEPCRSSYRKRRPERRRSPADLRATLELIL
jgi:hypothetical protein